MKKLTLLVFAVILAACSNDKEPLYKDSSASIEERVEDLLSRMTLEEKVLQMTQSYMERNDNENNVADQLSKVPSEIGSMINYGWDSRVANALQKRAIEETRLGIPIIFGYDAIHGFRTCFAIPLAQGASFNRELVGEAARITAQEAYMGGINWSFSPMVDIARDARWGRVMEGYGEDPYLTSEMAVATVKAYQGDDPSQPGYIAACLKHFTGYSAAVGGRDYTAVEISMQSLWDTYLPPYEAGIKAGALTVMSAFQTLNGVPASANRYLLTDVFRQKMGCDGFMVSDWGTTEQLVLQQYAEDDVQACQMAVEAGLDMDMCDLVYHKHLVNLVREGKVSEKLLDESVRRILRVKFRLGLFDNPYRPETDHENDYLKPEYLDIVERLASEVAVLLKNENNTLPLSKNARIAVVGPVADDCDAPLGAWRGHSFPSEVTSILEGIKEVYPNVTYAKGCDFEGDDRNGIAAAVRAARNSDVVVVCIGEKARWSGENHTRSTIALPAIQEELLAAVAATGKPVVVLIESGRPIDLVRIEPMADALMAIWHMGVREGQAVAGLLCGKYNPSGKLPITFPYTTGQCPMYYNERPLCRRNQWGQYLDIQLEPKYPFGYGLSYADFEYSDITLDGLTAKVSVTNKSDVDGKEAVLWFITDKACSVVARPWKELKYFEKKLIPAGQTVEFVYEIDKLGDLGFINHEGERFFESGEFILSAGDKQLTFRM